MRACEARSVLLGRPRTPAMAPPLRRRLDGRGLDPLDGDRRGPAIVAVEEVRRVRPDDYRVIDVDEQLAGGVGGDVGHQRPRRLDPGRGVAGGLLTPEVLGSR